MRTPEYFLLIAFRQPLLRPTRNSDLAAHNATFSGRGAQILDTCASLTGSTLTTGTDQLVLGLRFILQIIQSQVFLQLNPKGKATRRKVHA